MGLVTFVRSYRLRTLGVKRETGTAPSIGHGAKENGQA